MDPDESRPLSLDWELGTLSETVDIKLGTCASDRGTCRQCTALWAAQVLCKSPVVYLDCGIRPIDQSS